MNFLKKQAILRDLVTKGTPAELVYVKYYTYISSGKYYADASQNKVPTLK